MKNSLVFRGWYYFRNGWSVYFAFIFAAINTLTVTYYLAIENIPVLQNIFPSFLYYVITVVLLGVPLLILIGYAHYKKSRAYRSEASVNFESNPFPRRTLINSEIILRLNLEILEILKNSNNQISDSDKKHIDDVQKELKRYVPKRKLDDTSDLDYLKKLYDS
tara:strand:- start:133 stop:621 length:489 start_codon:yes stop_codon:yes gene_type:complete